MQLKRFDTYPHDWTVYVSPCELSGTHPGGWLGYIVDGTTEVVLWPPIDGGWTDAETEAARSLLTGIAKTLPPKLAECPHHWTVTSECPNCLRDALGNARKLLLDSYDELRKQVRASRVVYDRDTVSRADVFDLGSRT